MPEIVLRLAGEAGQASLALTGDTPGLRAIVDQHVSEIRDALTPRNGRKLTPAMLVNYAQGFVEAAIGRGWWPPHRHEHLGPGRGLWPGSEPSESAWPDAVWPGSGSGSGSGDSVLDWESLRLAAVCRMLLDAQGLAV